MNIPPVLLKAVGAGDDITVAVLAVADMVSVFVGSSDEVFDDVFEAVCALLLLDVVSSERGCISPLCRRAREAAD